MTDKINFIIGNSSEEDSNDSFELVISKKDDDDGKLEQGAENNIYDFDLDTIKDKPWLKPGADITDYFNYGFTEATWKKYCEMQRDNREFSDRNKPSYEKSNDDRYPRRKRPDDERFRESRRYDRYNYR